MTNPCKFCNTTISDTVERKFIEVNRVSDWEVLTDSGYKPIISSNKTIKYVVYEIILDNGYYLKCADDHIVFDETFNEIFVKELSVGQYIQTNSGLSKIQMVKNLDYSENMYDLSVDSKDHRFYTNGILSHNSTVVAGFVSWYVLFNSNKNAMILANKMATAKEIFSRVQFMIESCPKWLQQGVKEWNKTSFVLENGSKVSCAATSPSAARGQSISLLVLDEFAFLRPSLAEEFIASVFPTISSAESSKLVIVSTPNGMNHYYKLWTEALQGINGFTAIESHWSNHPKRTQKWADEQRTMLGQVKYNQEIECVTGETVVTIRRNGEIVSVPISELYSLLSIGVTTTN